VLLSFVKFHINVTLATLSSQISQGSVVTRLNQGEKRVCWCFYESRSRLHCLYDKCWTRTRERHGGHRRIARRPASHSTCCKQRWTLNVINWRQSNVQSFGPRFQTEVLLLLKKPEFPYSTVYDEPRVTSLPKTSSIYSAVSMETDLCLTDRERQTNTGHTVILYIPR